MMKPAFADLARLTGIALALCAPISMAPAPSAAQTETATLEFPYFTVRNRTGSSDPSNYYGGERSDLKAGTCRLETLDLGMLSPLADVVPNFLQEELLRVREVRETEPSRILDGLGATAAPHGPTLYVHGYYIDFDKGCRRAALLQRNVGLEGRFLWFSWPSDGAAASYTHDETDLYWSLPDLADTVIEMDRRFGSGAVHVIGHSLGARGVVLALAEVAHRRPDMQLGHVVLLAPDMDFGIFARTLPRIRPIAKSITVYVTAGDKPLALSAQLHGNPRLGEAGNDVSGLEGVDVIDLSALPGEGPTGHLYHIYSRAVGADLRRLLEDGDGAASREGLIAEGTNLWHMQPPSQD